MKRVVVHIDRLVLRGFAREDRDGIAEGVRQQLGELLVNAGAAQNLTDMPSIHRLSVGNVHVAHGAKPIHIGKLIAGGIIRGGRR
jgi:hypothetical protein